MTEVSYDGFPLVLRIFILDIIFKLVVISGHNISTRKLLVFLRKGWQMRSATSIFVHLRDVRIRFRIINNNNSEHTLPTFCGNQNKARNRVLGFIYFRK